MTMVAALVENSKEEKMLASRRAGFFAALVVVIITIIAVIGYWQQKGQFGRRISVTPIPPTGRYGFLATPSPDKRPCPSVIYQNKELGYEVCYPKGWFYKEFGEGKETVGFDQRPVPEATDYLGRFVIRVVGQPLNESVSYFERVLTDRRKEQALVGTFSGTKVEGTISPGALFFAGQRQMVFLVEKEGKTYEFSFTDTSDGYVSLLPTFLDFVESFHFTAAQPSKVLSPSGNIIVTSPMPNSLVKSPVTISGKARVFENVVSIRLEGSKGEVLVRTTAYAKASDVGSPSRKASADQGQFGEFSAPLYFYPPTPPSSGVLKVFVISTKDGKEEDVISIPLRFR